MSQFTANSQNVLHLNQCTHGHSWSRTVVTSQWSRGVRETNMFWLGVLSFWIEAGYTMILSVPTNKNKDVWGLKNMGAMQFVLLHLTVWHYMVCLGVHLAKVGYHMLKPPPPWQIILLLPEAYFPATPRKLSADIHSCKPFSLFWCVEFTPEVCPRISVHSV
jgi:hypothetical protein